MSFQRAFRCDELKLEVLKYISLNLNSGIVIKRMPRKLYLKKPEINLTVGV